MRMLIVTQLSNYDTQGRFILECDSGWQMMMGRVRVMLDMDPDLIIDITGPLTEDCGNVDACQVKTDPSDVNPDVWETYGPNGEDRLRYIDLRILPNALATRYDFNWSSIAVELDLGMHKIRQARKYDIVYLNDPMHLRNFRALFHIVGGYAPKFVTHSHFIDDPDCPKFPTEASLWLGQCEAAIRSDWNFWQCESSMKVFFEQMGRTFQQEVVRDVWRKSEPWDDGYSSREIRSPINPSNLRFNVGELLRLTQEKVVIFVPNRIGGRGRSSDYTNCGRFMFDHLPELARLRAEGTGDRDYIVICGNPSQKILNHELEQWCGAAGYLSIVPDALNRDEFKWIASHAHIAVGLYNQDSYGGTVARECVELGCLPFWADNYEYHHIAVEAGGYPHLTHPQLFNVPKDLSRLIELVRDPFRDSEKETWLNNLQQVTRKRCSYEQTTRAAHQRMKGLLP